MGRPVERRAVEEEVDQSASRGARPRGRSPPYLWFPRFAWGPAAGTLRVRIPGERSVCGAQRRKASAPCVPTRSVGTRSPPPLLPRFFPGRPLNGNNWRRTPCGKSSKRIARQGLPPPAPSRVTTPEAIVPRGRPSAPARQPGPISAQRFAGQPFRSPNGRLTCRPWAVRLGRCLILVSRFTIEGCEMIPHFWPISRFPDPTMSAAV